MSTPFSAAAAAAGRGGGPDNDGDGPDCHHGVQQPAAGGYRPRAAARVVEHDVAQLMRDAPGSAERSARTLSHDRQE
jgi:hypothetical protein